MKFKYTETDTAFIEKLFSLYNEDLKRFCISYLRTRPELMNNADDFVQETFLQAIKCQKKLVDHVNVFGWLYLTCKKRCDSAIARYNRRKRILKQPVSLDTIPELSDPSDSIVQWLCQTDIKEKLHLLNDKLTPLERSVFDVYFLDHSSLKETSKRCGVSIDSVRGSIQRIRKKLIEINFEESRSG